MKIKSFRCPRLVMSAVAQGRSILRIFWQLAVAHRAWGLIAIALALLLAAWELPYDMRVLHTLHFWRRTPEEIAHQFAYFLGTWGDYPTYNLPLAAVIWLYGVVRKNRAWRRIGVTCLLGASLAGIFDDFFRLTLGRPRPDAHLPDGLYGWRYGFLSKYQSFPSGHAAAVFGTALSLLMLNRFLGILATLYAFGVCWARMELYRHYPSDIMVGTAIGVYFGFMIGWAAHVKDARFTPASAPG